eukprot:TRINITY_DN63903_c0_g1_i2.p2 TRINITY_DN63903_c0_g1~~TRINITY_DN63903_c0_g1_i2.p2  ORF type:complete len:143 (-),score=6.35 TRINITY_DN63903_c0_g1_i2:348-776(-)
MTGFVLTAAKGSSILWVMGCEHRASVCWVVSCCCGPCLIGGEGSRMKKDCGVSWVIRKVILLFVLVGTVNVCSFHFDLCLRVEGSLFWNPSWLVSPSSFVVTQNVKASVCLFGEANLSSVVSQGNLHAEKKKNDVSAGHQTI